MLIHQNGSNLAFITGCPRSGTTWLHRLIASHPLVATGQESNLFDFYIGPQLRTWKDERKYFDARGPNGLHTYVRESEFLEIIRNYAAALLGHVPVPEQGIFLEKTPSHVCFLQEIAEVFPRCKIILIHRHPFDTVASLLSAGRSWGRIWGPKNVIHAARMWKHYARCALVQRSRVPRGQLYETSFERLKDRGQEVLQEMFAFLHLACTRTEVAAYLEANRPGSPRMTKIPLYGEYQGRFVTEPEGFYRQPGAGYHLSFWSKLVVSILCGQEMLTLGYEFRH